MNRRLENQHRHHRYRTDWLPTGTQEKRIVITRVLRDHLVEERQGQIHLDAMLEQAILDDLKNNNGRMFGHDALAFFTSYMGYPEAWACIQIANGEGLLERMPSHPHQTVVKYRYSPSREFGGKDDRPRFTITDRGEL